MLSTMLRGGSLMPLLFFTVVLLLLGSSQVAALRVRPTVEVLTFEVGKEEVCMYSKGRDFFEGAMMHYHVLVGGDDFNVFIRNPLNKTIYASYAGEHGLEDRVYFTTRSKNEYAYCIDNRQYTGERKRIRMEVGITSLKRWKARIDPLQRLMHRTEASFLGLIEDNLFLRMREASLRDEMENLFELLTVRTGVEVLVIIAVAIANALLVGRLVRHRLGKLNP